MRSGLWIAGAVASATMAIGCGQTSVKTDEAMLGRLSMDDKQAVFTAEHNIEVAQANQASAERALGEAKSYRDITNNEVKGAKAQFEAAQKSVVMGRQANDQAVAAAGQEKIVGAEKQLVAFKTKEQYANRLVDLRQEEVNLTKKQVEAAQIDRSIARAEALRRGGVTPREDISKLTRDRADKLGDVASSESKISAMREEVNGLRVAWEQRRKSYNVAARESGAAEPPPPPPANLSPEPLPKTPPAAPPPAPPM